MSFTFKFLTVQSELQTIILKSLMISEHKGSKKMIMPIAGGSLESPHSSLKKKMPAMRVLRDEKGSH